MATHSSILAWSIPWTEEPGELQSMGSQKSWTRLSDQTTIGQVCVAGSGCVTSECLMGPGFSWGRFKGSGDDGG